MKKSLLIAALLSASLGSGIALAERGEKGDCEYGHDKKPSHHERMGGHHMKRGDMMQREFSADEIRTLAEARLIMQGNKNLKVGQVSSTKSGYTVAITTQDGSLVEEKAMAKNGMPLEKYEHMKKRMEERQKHKEEGKKHDQ